jgi:hypothetical protein
LTLKIRNWPEGEKNAGERERELGGKASKRSVDGVRGKNQEIDLGGD